MKSFASNFNSQIKNSTEFVNNSTEFATQKHLFEQIPYLPMAENYNPMLDKIIEADIREETSMMRSTGQGTFHLMKSNSEQVNECFENE